MTKTHNAPGALRSKVELRRRVLDAIGVAHVFDVYCGPVGEMWIGAWRDAASYVGCDLEWRKDDERRRFVGDAKVVLRSIDLAPFNVFDVDAFGSPFEALNIIGARKRWEVGELGAVVVTDGASLYSRYGKLPNDIAKMTGMGATGHAPTTKNAAAVSRLALKSWLQRNGLTPVHHWRTTSRGSGRGNALMFYDAVVFRAQASGSET